MNKSIFIRGISALFVAVSLTASLSFDTLNAQSALPKILTDPEVQSEHPLPDYSYAGYEYGLGEIPTRGVTIHVDDYGAVADDERDDSAA
ncbi:MAG: hypothetical protein AAF692_03950, partial [Pseudomonadota bacterium]